jgi:hypothetical protein
LTITQPLGLTFADALKDSVLANAPIIYVVWPPSISSKCAHSFVVSSKAQAQNCFSFFETTEYFTSRVQFNDIMWELE